MFKYYYVTTCDKPRFLLDIVPYQEDRERVREDYKNIYNEGVLVFMGKEYALGCKNIKGV